MAFMFSEIKPVQFGKIVAMPKITAELKLRLKQIKNIGSNYDEMRDILSQCFGEKSEQVKEFIRVNFSDLDYARLQVYLLDGDKGVEDFERRMDSVVISNMKQAMSEARNND